MKHHLHVPILMAILLGLLAAAGTAPARGEQTITLDGTREGRTFEGIGAVSGGGATSRFLIEYPEPQRSQILDYLFKPNFGAALQVLYVEMGSDKNGTQGSEPSHARSREELDHPKPEYFDRGYEWWLMKEAKKRNPAIRFDVTAWNAPLWVGSGKGGGGFWSQDMCDYYVSWIRGAKTYHDLDVQYTGCRNEMGVNLPWVKSYRRTLDEAGLKNVVIHGFDNWRPESKWLFAKELATDAELNRAVGIISNHTTWKGSPEGPSPSPDYVLQSGKPIWDTEAHVYQDGFGGAINKVRCCNEDYIDNRVTSTVFWHLISAFYRIEGWYGKHAMAIASSPWSGNYIIAPELWGHAHTCQLTRIGWKFLEGEACGYFQGGGSYVSCKSPGGTDYTIVIETKNAKADQTVKFRITGGLPAAKLSVWNHRQYLRRRHGGPRHAYK
jgi:galactosylceramidase